ncbi:homeobox protein cut-like 1 isoform X2 [Hordeum vulgare subsp. vulgare]|nr:homeobox protein cut-like 1 isoform X2 [Hordeum vulgare subsp. vulgare]XP_044981523.1 homeobox protein cut-like 1 isoform X2 [Hordeum vulgare subsp. vulgare]XP_044981524.1 homeobox protein cut-like 1 isoform X2 [Hordeum vulgare subsp. vulgare]
MALPGGPTTPTPEQPEPLRLAEEEVREAELFEDAVDVSPTASAHPVTWREGEAAPSSSPSMSVSIPPRSEAGAADDEEEAYESPPASGASGPPGIDSAGWSPSVSESREGSASPSGSARGARRRRRGIGGPCRGQQARQGWRTQGPGPRRHRLRPGRRHRLRRRSGRTRATCGPAASSGSGSRCSARGSSCCALRSTLRLWRTRSDSGIKSTPR